MRCATRFVVFLLILAGGTLLGMRTIGVSAQSNPPNRQQTVPVPQSRHYPIKLLCHGNDRSWSISLGPKGPEKWERPGYPPIPLEPGAVAQEGAADSWIYRAKDTATGADVAVRLQRLACSEPNADKPLPFTVAAEHAQLGSFTGCANFAPELFPTEKQEDKDEEPKKPPPSYLSLHSKPPVAVAYHNQDGRVMFSRARVSRIVAESGYDLSLSHDGKKLLFVRDEPGGQTGTINEYDFDTGHAKELLRGKVRAPFWSPDDSRVAFLKFEDGKWQLWALPANDPLTVSLLNHDNLDSIDGWADTHILLANDLQNLVWIGDDGNPKQVLTLKEICGADFLPYSGMTIRLHPANSDLLLISTLLAHPPPDVPVDPKEHLASGMFLYEIRSKRRVALSVAGLSAKHGEWSRDGLQIYFSGFSITQKPATYRIFWDGTELKSHRPGTDLVIGQ